MQQGRRSVAEIGEALELTARQANSFERAVDRAMGAAVAASIKNATAAKQSAQAGKQNADSMQQQADAARKLAEEEKRVFDARGLSRNSAGRVVNTDTGKFASKSQITDAQAQMRTLEQINALEERRGDLERMRAINAQNSFKRDQETLFLAREQTHAYQERQKVLERAFSSNIVGLASPDASGWDRLRNVLNQIPPATWTQKLGAANDALERMGASGRYALYSVAQSSAAAGAALIGFSTLSVTAAVSHERAFANVQRTTQTTALGYEQLRRQLEQMAMEIPVTYEELTNIASAAGQLGISASGVANFTRTVAMLTATTNLSSDAAGNALARFKAFFAEAEDSNLAVTDQTLSNLASSILKVGINSIATESGIVNVSTQISSMGKYAGFTADQVIGLSGALSSVGVAPELARGITTRLFTIMGDAVAAGGVQLEKFATIAGVSGSEFKAAWGTQEMGPLFTQFVAGLHDISASGGDANRALQDLGITAVRDRPVWLRLADAAGETGAAGSLLAQTMKDARDGWTENIELAKQYGIISRTTSARLQVMSQAFEQLFATMGKQSASLVGDLAGFVTELVKGFEDFSNSGFGQFMSTAVVQLGAVMGAVLILVGGLALTAATAQGVNQAFREMTAAGVGGMTRLTAATRVAALSMGALGLVGALVAVVGVIASMGAAAERNKTSISDMSAIISAMQSDAENGSGSIKFLADSNGEAADAADRNKKNTDDLAQALYGVKPAADEAADGADRVSYSWGNAARNVLKAQLAMSDSFQKLFNAGDADIFDKIFGGAVPTPKGVNPVEFDWDAILDESVRKGGDTLKLIQKQILAQLKPGSEEFKAAQEQFQFGDLGSGAFNAYAIAVRNSVGENRSAIQAQLDANSALEQNTKHTVNEMIDDFSLLTEADQKVADDIAKAFGQFTDPKLLIGLTQKFNEIMSQADASGEEKASQWSDAWSEAYGGAAFSLEEYLTTFRNGAQEQQTFIEGIQQLGARGVSPQILQDLASMGPEAARLVQALVQGTDEQLGEFEALWGKTGYDSQIKFATQAALGQQIVSNVLRSSGLEGLRAFNDALSSGVGVDAALAQLQLDINGKPLAIPPPAIAAPDPNSMMNDLQRRLNERALTIRVSATASNATFVSAGGQRSNVPFASGGYTGPGGKYQEAGTVHAGEFVMDAASTRAIGVGNLYALMRSSKGGRAAPRGGGYANGGYVRPAGGLAAEVSLTAGTIQAIASAVQPYLYLDGKRVGQSGQRYAESQTRMGSY